MGADMTPSIVDTAKAHGRLNMTGFGDPAFDPITEEHQDQFDAARAYLLAIGALLRASSRNARRRLGSYDLKHLAEWWWRQCGGHGYIANGALIAAALSLGWHVAENGVNGIVHAPK